MYLNNRWRWKREVAQAIDEESRSIPTFRIATALLMFFAGMPLLHIFFQSKNAAQLYLLILLYAVFPAVCFLLSGILGIFYGACIEFPIFLGIVFPISIIISFGIDIDFLAQWLNLKRFDVNSYSWKEMLMTFPYTALSFLGVFAGTWFGRKVLRRVEIYY